MELEVNNVYLINMYFMGYVKSLYDARSDCGLNGLYIFHIFTYHMTVRPHSRAPIKNHTEMSRDGVRTGLGERAVKSRPARRKGVRTRSVSGVCGVFLLRLFLFSTPLVRFFF
jgi:hypothetical protein